MPLMINRNEVQSVLQMEECIDAHEKAFNEMAAGTAALPLRTPIKPPDGLSLYMPAYLQEMNALACKVVTVYKDNPASHGLPVVIGTVLLQDAATGQVICIEAVWTSAKPNGFWIGNRQSILMRVLRKR